MNSHPEGNLISVIGTANPSVGRVNCEQIIKYTQEKVFSVISVANPSVKKET